MYDDFRRAKRSIKKVLAVCRHDDHLGQRTGTLNFGRNCLRREADFLDLDLDLNLDLDSYRLTNKEGRRCVAGYNWPDQVNTAARLHNFIKNLVTSLKSKIAARFRVEKVVTEDVNALESFLQVIAPRFMNCILPQKQIAEPKDQIETDSHPQSSLVEKGAENKKSSNSTDNAKENNEGSSPDIQENGNPSTFTDNIKERINSNPGNQKSTAYNDRFPNTETNIDTDKAHPNNNMYERSDSPRSDYFAKKEKKEQNSFSLTKRCNVSLHTEQANSCDLDFFCRDQKTLEEQTPSYPSFEQQFENDYTSSESSPLYPRDKVSATGVSFAEINVEPGKNLGTTGAVHDMMRSSLNGDAWQLQRCLANRKTLETLFSPNNSSYQDLLLKISFPSEKQTLRANEATRLNDRVRVSKPRRWSSCRYSVPGVGQGSSQSMIPLDFNLNALHIKSAFTEDQVEVSGCVDAKNNISVGNFDTSSDPESSDMCYNRDITSKGRTGTLIEQTSQQRHAQKLAHQDCNGKERIFSFSNMRNIEKSPREESDISRQAEYSHGQSFQAAALR
ncbi:hypothetical protein ElyMa_005563700 [Elysia marginata]|uniref:Uncharacterized protein n=1 Tax=Elysia marginata TaxID=1093978 RepID=A0AAV4F1C5_9GAST|nr:hypothetical protein ElyMa_005563700 [Elysia marginata]